MAYNKSRQLQSNKKWIDEDRTYTEVSDKCTYQDKNDDGPSEEETKEKDFVKRRNFGKKGKKITVIINYVSIHFTDPNAFVFHYKVRIEPEPNRLKLSRKIFEITEAERFPNSTSAFDGRKSLYTRKPISASRTERRMSRLVNISSEQNNFNIIKRFNGIENRNWLPTSFKCQSSSYKECKYTSENIPPFYTVMIWDEEFMAKRSFKIYVHLYDILKYEVVHNTTQSSSDVLKFVEAMLTIVGENALKKCEQRKLIQSGGILFTRNGDPVGNITGGLNVHFGFRQIVVKQAPLFHYNFLMALDMTYGCFYDPMPVIDLISLICEKPKIYLRNSLLEPWELQAVKNYLLGLRVVYQDPGYGLTEREHIVSDVAVNAETIRLKIGSQSRFNGFYSLEKCYDLEFPNMPSIVVGPPGMMLGLPPEQCTIADGQIFNRRMANAQKEALKEFMLEFKPEPRQIKNEITKLVTALGLEKNNFFSELDIQISKNLLQTIGRVLKPPTLVCKSAMFSGIKQVLPSDSCWDLEHFENPVRIEKWAICSVDPSEDTDLKFLATALRFRGLRLGMKIDEPKLYSKLVQGEEDLEKYLKIFLRERKSENYEVVLVVMPNSGIFYGKIKQIAELQVGILTQCLKSSTVKNLDLSIMNNLLLKLNAKLNGNSFNIKYSLWPKYFIRPVLVVGAFVNVNEPIRNPGFPYIASIVGNYNKHATKHYVIWSFMKSNSDYIENLDRIIGKLMIRYWKENGVYPEKILYYRDGIPEENIWMVMEEEVKMIREGCASLHPLYKPSLTFIDVTRNHPAMFLPNKQTNIPAGTVVDSSIVHPNEVEFFLMSDVSYLGTPRPTKYHLLMDESHLSEDDIQEITFYLCHLSCRCTHTVPFPVQVYYARLATHRAQKYFDRSFSNEEEVNKTIDEILNVNALLQHNPMFFV
ncbi:protein argonaute-2-like isoform X1 [Halyomorpha halys]|uniref:protein argonaute-2-like isoform X1 n=2 Tax=Halyomorpha halys TaxID=286706 RepID=UPI0034D30920